MLKYEWRPGQPIGNNDAYMQNVTIYKSIDTIVPPPVTLHNEGDGNLEDNNNEYVYMHQGAETLQVNDAIQDINIVEDQGAQGAQGDENQGANNKNQGANPIKVEDVHHNTDNEEGLFNKNEIKDEPTDDSGSKPEPEHQNTDREKRSAHFEQPNEGHFGRGK